MSSQFNCNASAYNTNRFKNHELMRKELKAAGVVIPDYCKHENNLVHLYDITFLVNFKLQNSGALK